MFRRITILALLTIVAFEAVAQTDTILVQNKDSIAYRYTPITYSTPNPRMRKWREAFARYITESGADRSFERAIDFSIVPTIYYVPSTSLGLALMANGLYRLDKSDRALQPSNVSIFATASITGFYRVGVRGSNIFPGDKQRILYNAEFYSQPVAFWGLGYAAAMGNTPLNYLASRTIVEARFLQRATKGLYVGVGADFNYHFGNFVKRIGKGSYSSEADLLARLDGQRVGYSATGISLFVEYDTRDFIPSPQRGVYLAVEGMSKDELDNLVAQFNAVECTPEYPGSYIIGRFTNFAFLGAYNNDDNPVEKMRSYLDDINAELTRKRQEFDLPTTETFKELGSVADDK